MDTLSILFGTALRVKMMRLFLFNPGGVFDFDQIESKMNVKPRVIQDEIVFLKKAGLIKVQKVMKLVTVKKRQESIN